MAKRSLSKTFDEKSYPHDIIDWLVANLPLMDASSPEESDYLKDRVMITIHFDTKKKGSLIPEGPKEAHDNGSSKKEPK